MKYTIRQARELCGLSQEQMAKEINMSVPTYIKKDKGETRVYLDESLDIVEVCRKHNVDISIEDIIPAPIK